MSMIPIPSGILRKCLNIITVHPCVAVAVMEYAACRLVQPAFIFSDDGKLVQDIPVIRASGAPRPLHAIDGVASAVLDAKSRFVLSSGGIGVPEERAVLGNAVAVCPRETACDMLLCMFFAQKKERTWGLSFPLR